MRAVVVFGIKDPGVRLSEAYIQSATYNVVRSSRSNYVLLLWKSKPCKLLSVCLK